jgi:hypothetical protein
VYYGIRLRKYERNHTAATDVYNKRLFQILKIVPCKGTLAVFDKRKRAYSKPSISLYIYFAYVIAMLNVIFVVAGRFYGTAILAFWITASATAAAAAAKNKDYDNPATAATAAKAAEAAVAATAAPAFAAAAAAE